MLAFVVPNAFAEVYVDNDHKYLGDDGTIHIVGEIINESDKPINQVNVIAIFILMAILFIRQTQKI
uniref:DUF3426 domain-containing protein n=1 Tax=uncultured marine thaumarchaeote AD1000_50_E11 TaxID=1455923 RepID=A0A075FTP8_9ARCH|nr:hypothetical protein [uncultured marine thaumarchaeote AD1000_50_E11]